MNSPSVPNVAYSINPGRTAVSVPCLWLSASLQDELFPDLILSAGWQNILAWGLVILAILFIHILMRRELQARRRTEIALSESQRYLAMLMAKTPGMTFQRRTDPNFTMIQVSEGCLALTGYLPEELVSNKQIAWSQLIHPSQREEVRQQMQSALRAEKPFHLIYGITTAEGKEKWVSEQGQPVYSAKGELQRIDGFITDITSRVITRQTLEQRVAERTRELATLLEVSHSIVSMLELEPLLHLVLDQLKKVVHYSGAAILMLENDMLVVRAYRHPDPRAAAVKVNFSPARIPSIEKMLETKRPVCVANLIEDEALARVLDLTNRKGVEEKFQDIPSWMGVPLIVRGEVKGMLSLTHLERGYYDEHHAQLAQAFANQVAIAMHNAELYQKAQETAVAGERSRLARELHDSVTQAIYSVTLYADATRLALEAGEVEVVNENLKELRAMAREAMLDMRLLIFELRPPVLEEEGLVAAIQSRLEAVEARSGVEATFNVVGERRLPLSLETELYRIAQEALTNVYKHARARQVQVNLNFAQAAVCLEIKDDGVGFDTSIDHSGGLGLNSIRERVEEVGGHFLVESKPGGGTTLRIEVLGEPYRMANGRLP